MTDSKNTSSKSTTLQFPKLDYKVELHFISDYLNLTNDFKSEVRLIDWIRQ